MIFKYRLSQRVTRSLPASADDARVVVHRNYRPAREILCVLLCSLLLGLLTGCQPPPRQAIIDGSSMAPHLYGAHSELVCEDCGFRARFRLDLALENLLCPNCGAANPATRLNKQPSLQVAVEHLAGQPQRWEIVAFYSPTTSQESPRLAVKRIVGLPGEELKIAEGDLWRDGQRLAKSWDEQRELAILLRDFDFLPRSGNGELRSPWSTANTWAAWKLLADGVELNSEGAVPSPMRLEYQHWAGYQSAQPRFAPIPVLDAQPFDPREARSLAPVYDLLLSGEVMTPQASFRIGFEQFEQTISCEFFPATGKLIVCEGAAERQEEFTYTPPATAYRFGVSTFDRQLTVAINDQPVLQWPITSPPQQDRQRLGRPLYLESAEGPVRLRHLQLFRDVHYLGRAGGEQSPAVEQTYRLGSNEFLLLGDNPQDSIDSRDWAQAGLPKSRVLGRIKRISPE